MIASIISYISVFSLLVSLVNIILSLIVFYAFNDYCDIFRVIRWPVSTGIIFLLVICRKIIINDVTIYRQ